MITKNEITSELLPFIENEIGGNRFRTSISRQRLFRSTPYGRDTIHISLIAEIKGISIVPDLAIRFDDLENLVFENTTNLILPKTRKDANSIGVSLSYFCAERLQQWNVEEREELPAVGHSIGAAVKNCGLLFFDQYSSMSEVFHVLTNWENEKLANIFCPVPLTRALNATGLAFILRKREEFCESITKFERQLETINNSGIETYREFINNLSEKWELEK